MQKVFSTKFQAFKFPDREVVHINCGIHLCKGECPRSCDGAIRGKLHKPLARIEVFNSLKVLAPQIEIDRPVEKNQSNGNLKPRVKMITVSIFVFPQFIHQRTLLHI